ncbi:hypothetical protein KKI23_03365 [Patescibacteria group bacterium]|nr:hypothetical protein [Patescibacteria group bacterium]
MIELKEVKMKKIIMFALLIGFLVSVSNALDLAVEKEKLVADQTNFTFGLGWAGNEFLGGITRDGLDNPKTAYGLNNWLGFSYTWIYGAPTEQEILAAVDAVVAEEEGAASLRSYDLKRLTKQKLNIGSYSYFRIGTVYLVLPLIAQYGWMWPVGDVGRFQIGLGLPLLFNVGINFDF